MSALVVSPVQQDVYAVLQPFIATVTGLDPSVIIQGLPNRVGMPPASPGFVTMQATRMPRIATDVDDWDQTSDIVPEATSIEQSTEIVMQLDCYGADSGDWAVMLCALLRDEFGCAALAPTCQPLYTDDPLLAPLEDSEDQYEQRWTVISHLQYNPVITAPMQFADTLTIDVINVDEAYPP